MRRRQMFAVDPKLSVGAQVSAVIDAVRHVVVEVDPAPVQSCPKCGRILKKQGAHFHIRACQG